MLIPGGIEEVCSLRSGTPHATLFFPKNQTNSLVNCLVDLGGSNVPAKMCEARTRSV